MDVFMQTTKLNITVAVLTFILASQIRRTNLFYVELKYIIEKILLDCEKSNHNFIYIIYVMGSV